MSASRSLPTGKVRKYLQVLQPMADAMAAGDAKVS